MKKDEPLKGNASELLKSIKATATFKSTYEKDISLLTAMLQNRFNKPTLDELSDYQLEELGKYLKKLDSYQTGKTEMATKNQISLIKILWSQSYKGKDTELEKALDAYIKGLGALTKKDAQKIIGGLRNGTN
ncbi:phage protein GemA/Gp16 family protein [Sulfurimonas sp.]|uniref:phage protein GemA/Gp16 family protein n=1 Tax=Sulfurimonas sp. TaxID=2022749 RepID=UPI002B476DAC|nr:phage protein GemA/Gp16 family protein [Sulfurimonas sp.]